MPSLSVRKQRALEQELDATLAETCDNIEQDRRKGGAVPKRSDSKESVTSTHSDSVYERVARGNKVCGCLVVRVLKELLYTLSEAWSGVDWADLRAPFGPIFMTGLPER